MILQEVLVVLVMVLQGFSFNFKAHKSSASVSEPLDGLSDR